MVVCSPRRSGSILITLVVGLFIFVGVYGMIAAGQLLHARRLNAEYGRLQAIYAAESGVYAGFAAGANVGTTMLWSADGSAVSYKATFETPGAPAWILGEGEARVRGDVYTAKVRGYTIGTRVLLWDFGT